MIDDKKEEAPTTMKDIGIGNHVVSLMKKCSSISSLESPKNLMKLSKVAKNKGVEKFGRNSSMVLFNRKKGIMGDSLHKSTEDSAYNDTFGNENILVTEEAKDVSDQIVDINTVSMAIEKKLINIYS